eukprot:scaffold794_cov113-Isochrysis_galbana.AAC.2
MIRSDLCGRARALHGGSDSPLSTHPIVRTEVVHTVQSPPLQAGSCQVCRSMKGEGDRGLGEIGESEC